MSRFLFNSILTALAAGVAAVVLAIALPRGEGVVIDLYVLLLGALVVVNLVAATHAAHVRHPSRFDAAVRRRRRVPERPVELVRLEALVLLAATRSFDYHYRLRPRLREIAVQRLATARGIDADRDPARARAALGSETWDLLRDDRKAPSDRLAPGLGTGELARLVAAIERIQP